MIQASWLQLSPVVISEKFFKEVVGPNDYGF